MDFHQKADMAQVDNTQPGQLVDQPSGAPTRKMKVVAISGAVIPIATTALVWVIMKALPGVSESSATEIAAALAVLVAGLVQGAITFINGYLARNRA